LNVRARRAAADGGSGNSERLMAKKSIALVAAIVIAAIALFGATVWAHKWNEAEFANRPLYAYPLPQGRNDIIGSLTTYRLQPGDTLLDVGRWFGLSAKEVSDANHHMDWWLPPAGQEIILPTEHILPTGPRIGITMNIPEMRLYYYYPPPSTGHRRHGKLIRTQYRVGRVVYTFPVGLGRFDWKTPIGDWRVVRKVVDPPWVLPDDIYQEHLERDGYAEHVIPGGAPDNPEGHFLLELNIPEYGLHGTDVPWGVGMTVSHGCVRLYPEDIERLYNRTPIGTPGRFLYEPIKFGWRGPYLYVEVHDDLYGKYPGMWNLAQKIIAANRLGAAVDSDKLEQAVVAKSGIPTYIGRGEEPSTSPIPYENESASAGIPSAGPGTDSGEVASVGDTSPADSSSPPSVTPAPPMTTTTTTATTYAAPPPAPDSTYAPPPAVNDPANSASPPDSGTIRIPPGGGIRAEDSGIE
jgi:L,D-transpeptidase ErfK/SrfK